MQASYRQDQTGMASRRAAGQLGRAVWRGHQQQAGGQPRTCHACVHGSDSHLSAHGSPSWLTLGPAGCRHLGASLKDDPLIESRLLEKEPLGRLMVQDGSGPSLGPQPQNAGSMDSTADLFPALSPATASTGDREDGCVLKSMHSTTAEQLAGAGNPLFSMSTDEALKAISEFLDTQHK